MTYSLLNTVFLVVAATSALAVLRGRQWITVAKVLGPMLLLTAVFDNLIIASGIVAYDPKNISGIKIGLAPVEDFGYTVAVALLMPAIWFFVEKRKK